MYHLLWWCTVIRVITVFLYRCQMVINHQYWIILFCSCMFGCWCSSCLFYLCLCLSVILEPVGDIHSSMGLVFRVLVSVSPTLYLWYFCLSVLLHLSLVFISIRGTQVSWYLGLLYTSVVLVSVVDIFLIPVFVVIICVVLLWYRHLCTSVCMVLISVDTLILVQYRGFQVTRRAGSIPGYILHVHMFDFYPKFQGCIICQNTVLFFFDAVFSLNYNQSCHKMTTFPGHMSWRDCFCRSDVLLFSGQM